MKHENPKPAPFSLEQELAEIGTELFAKGEKRLAKRVLHAHVEALFPDDAQTPGRASIAAEASTSHRRRRKGDAKTTAQSQKVRTPRS